MAKISLWSLQLVNSNHHLLVSTPARLHHFLTKLSRCRLVGVIKIKHLSPRQIYAASLLALRSAYFAFPAQSLPIRHQDILSCHAFLFFAASRLLGILSLRFAKGCRRIALISRFALGLGNDDHRSCIQKAVKLDPTFQKCCAALMPAG